MKNEAAVRNLIRGSIQRAILESIAALMVLIFFAVFLRGSEVGSPGYYGCLLILAGTGFIAGVVWSNALSYRLLRTHPASDVGFWREAFHAQARLLRLVPVWYCTPLGVGSLLFVAPTAGEELIPFLMVATIFVLVFTSIIWLNRKASICLEESADMLTN